MGRGAGKVGQLSGWIFLRYRAYAGVEPMWQEKIRESPPDPDKHRVQKGNIMIMVNAQVHVPVWSIIFLFIKSIKRTHYQISQSRLGTPVRPDLVIRGKHCRTG